MFSKLLLIQRMGSSITLLLLPVKGSFLVVGVIAVAHCPVRAAIPKESRNKPHKQEKRHYNGHDHVADLIAQVHKVTHNIECLTDRQNHDHTFNKQVNPVRKVGNMDQETQSQFHKGNAQQEPENPPDMSCVLLRLVVKSNLRL